MLNFEDLTNAHTVTRFESIESDGDENLNLFEPSQMETLPVCENNEKIKLESDFGLES